MFRTTLCRRPGPGLAHESERCCCCSLRRRWMRRERKCKASEHHAVHARAGSQHARRQAAAELAPKRPQKCSALRTGRSPRGKSQPGAGGGGRILCVAAGARRAERRQATNTRHRPHSRLRLRPKRRARAWPRSRRATGRCRRVQRHRPQGESAGPALADAIRPRGRCHSDAQRASQRLLAAVDLVCAGKHVHGAGNGGAPTRRPVMASNATGAQLGERLVGCVLAGLARGIDDAIEPAVAKQHQTILAGRVFLRTV